MRFQKLIIKSTRKRREIKNVIKRIGACVHRKEVVKPNFATCRRQKQEINSKKKAVMRKKVRTTA